MNYIPYIAIVVHACIRIANPSLRTNVLNEGFREQAIDLLSEQFVKREPLCRVLGLTQNDVRDIFADQVDFAIAQGLSMAVINRQGRLVGVATIEDHVKPYSPQTEPADERILYILRFLDSIVLPGDLQPENANELYYCGLAAVAKGKENRAALSLMILGGYWHLRGLGFRRGYAKITNDRIIARFKSLEKYALTQVFNPRVITRAADFEDKGHKPFQAYTGQTALYSWTMP